METGAFDNILAAAGLELVKDARGLALTDGVMTVRSDFSRMVKRLHARNLGREMLVKAAKVKRDGDEALRAVDATAGLGEDSLLLAGAGFEVTMFERNPVIAALLRNALARAADIPDLAEAVSHMALVEADSIQGLAQLNFEPDVVLLDPMFPAKGKDAAAKKKLQMLQRLESPCDDERALIDAAMAANPRKVVVKRPVKGPHLADRKPNYALAGKAIRYDVYTLPH